MSYANSSINKYNASRIRKYSERLLYLVLNWLNNRRPMQDLDQQLVIRPLALSVEPKNWPEHPTKSSPSRLLCDLFWKDMPWGKVKGALADVRAVDVGCGTGHYGPRFLAWSGDAIGKYTGIDHKFYPSWEEIIGRDRRFSFIVAKSESVEGWLPDDTNLVLSQSAIEHFDGDLVFFREIRDWARERGQPFIQVHLFPSAACLPLYLWHGVRQYTPRTVSKITRLFSEFSVSTLVPLGGRPANRLHREFITWPGLKRDILKLGTADRRERELEEYNRRLAVALAAEPSSVKHPSFYALVIESYVGKSIFD